MDKENNYLLLETIKPVYEEAIQVAYEAFRVNQDSASFIAAFELAEMSKASVLLNSIQHTYALRTGEVPDSIVEYEYQLRTEINNIKKLRAEEEKNDKQDNAKLTFYNSQLLDLMVSHDSLKGKIEETYPKYYKLKFDRSIIDLDTLMPLLKENEAILEYSLTDSAVFVFLVQRDTFNLLKVSIDERFHTALNRIIGLKDSEIGSLSVESINDFKDLSGHLWNCLIAPVYDQLEEKHLIIIPDGLLGYLPFEILVHPDQSIDASSFNQLTYLVEEFPVSYAHSSSLKYTAFFGDRKNAPGGVVTFSPSYSQDVFAGNRGLSLANLPYSDQESREVREIFGGKGYRNSKATKSTFVEEAGNYQMIHLAMHALINDSLPMLSELVFAPEKRDTNSNVLHTYEVYGLNLNADMITLSACNTGSGKLQKGEGIMSLARGFIYAGVPAVVMTLWEVQDKSGYEIMSSFYHHLKAGHPKDVALQKAKIEFIRSSNMLKGHPYFWSSYILSGDSSTLLITERNNCTNYAAYALILAAILLVTLIVHKRKRRKNRSTIPAP
jgi:CHAT domain-containing protein